MKTLKQLKSRLNRVKRSSVVVVALTAFAVPLARTEAALAQDAHGPEEFNLALHPAALDEPALKNRLIPEIAELTPGNAATMYLMAAAYVNQIKVDNQVQDSLLEAPPEKLSVQEAEKLVTSYRTVFDFLDVASHRTYCDWDPAIREQGPDALLPYCNSARQIANVLSIDVKLAVRQHRYDEAVRALRLGFTFARDLNTQAVVVQELVATGIQALMLHSARYLVQAPGAPNLYWPLANVPSAGEQRAKALQYERAMFYFRYPNLRHPEQLGAAECRQIVQALGRWRGGSDTERTLTALVGMIRDYPKAKKWLVAHGMDAGQVEAMPANAVVLAYDLAEYDRRADAQEKWAGVPLWQALRGMRQEQEGEDQREETLNPFLFAFFSSQNVLLQFAKADRERAILQTVEALRAHAAAHNGALPNSLGELSSLTPAPLDPVFGRPFDYERKGDTATLRAAAVEGRNRQTEQVYHIKVAR